MEEKSVKKELIKDEEVLKLANDMKEKYDIEKIKDWVKNNKLEFEHGGTKYRARHLSPQDKEELNRLRQDKFGELIQNKNVLLEKALIEVYKDRGIDVEDIKKQITNVENEIISYQLKLGEMLSKNVDEVVCKVWKEKIEAAQLKINSLIIQKSHLLEYSLENVLLNYVISVMTYLSLDKFENEQWIKAFNSFEDFNTMSDEEFVKKAVQLTTVINYF